MNWSNGASRSPASTTWTTTGGRAGGRLATRSGARHATLSLDDSLDYIDRVYADYLAYGGVDRFSGRVAEIGPGDNFGIALRMLGAGAREVHTVDRYRTLRDDARQARIHRALAGPHGLLDGGAGGNEIRGLRGPGPRGEWLRSGCRAVRPE